MCILTTHHPLATHHPLTTHPPIARSPSPLQHEAALRAQLKAEYEAQQAAIQAEPLVITYSYWNGTGNRRTATVRKGDTVGMFLAHVREQLSKEFREARCEGSHAVISSGRTL